MPKYSFIETSIGNKILTRIDGDDVISSIPQDLNNSDYQAYLRWLENPDADENGTL